MSDLNPQRDQMESESMVRTLEAQARAIWPQEEALVARYGLKGALRVLDAGCGTGEISSRIARMFPLAEVLGVDILDAPLELARERHASLAPRLSFAQGSIFELPVADATYDLTVCRHVLQSIPHADQVVRELRRVTKPGGWMHLIAEDYGMLHFPTGDRHVDAFWREGPASFGAATGTDLFVGRHAFGHLRALGLEEVTVEYVVVDTVRVEREIFATILEAWRDGYVEPIAKYSRFTREEATAAFEGMIGFVRDPARYAVWMVPVVAGRVPRGG